MNVDKNKIYEYNSHQTSNYSFKKGYYFEFDVVSEESGRVYPQSLNISKGDVQGQTYKGKTWNEYVKEMGGKVWEDKVRNLKLKFIDNKPTTW